MKEKHPTNVQYRLLIDTNGIMPRGVAAGHLPVHIGEASIYRTCAGLTILLCAQCPTLLDPSKI
jgi:hypothetical protein